eukprot:TRINITY_DN6721_c0_g1_i1.p1 TRINITY_DN6721_c0_g1~~TRINITY_DN6721_c0_g1_i1.p1  ORF type:complete len:684 (+),score=237.70 TRINITY_DN6721_c0_g1_i1:144-2195(+)
MKLELAAKKGEKKGEKRKTGKPDKPDTKTKRAKPAPQQAEAEAEAEEVGQEEEPAGEPAEAAEETVEEPQEKVVKKVVPKKELPRGPRTVMMTGFAQGTTKAHIKHRVKKVAAVEELELYEEDGQPTARVLFENAKGASTAMKKLDQHVFKGATLSVERVKELNPKAGRLIVRNLSFKVSSDRLRNEFSQCGEIVEVHIGKKPDGTKRGFAFVQFARKSAAANAIKKLNMTDLEGRKIAVDWALAQADFKAQMKAQDKKAAAEEEEEEEGEGEEEMEGVEQGDEAEEDGDEKEDEDDEEDEEDEEEDCKTEEQRLNEIGRSVFVRNIPFRSTKDDLHRALRRFGKIKSCVLVEDPKTGKSQGKGFVLFDSQTSVVDALAAAEPKIPEDMRVAGMHYPGDVMIEDRALILAPAVDRSTAQSLVSQKLDAKKKSTGAASIAEKRNLHLANEGLINSEMEAAAGMSEQDLEKREAAALEKKKKLSDPNNFVSSTRLSVRNLPTSTDEKVLKEMVRALFGPSTKPKQVKLVRDSGQRKGRSKGYGFIEMHTHDHALQLLRHLNNNPDTAGGKHKRPIVEFAVENVLKLRQLQASMKGGAAKEPVLAPKEKGGKKRKADLDRAEDRGPRKIPGTAKHVCDAETDMLVGEEEAARERGGKRSRKQQKERENKKERDFDKVLSAYKKTFL